MAMGKKYEQAIALVKQIEKLINDIEPFAKEEVRIVPRKNAEITLEIAKALHQNMMIVARYNDEDYG